MNTRYIQLSIGVLLVVFMLYVARDNLQELYRTIWADREVVSSPQATYEPQNKSQNGGYRTQNGYRVNEVVDANTKYYQDWKHHIYTRANNKMGEEEVLTPGEFIQQPEDILPEMAAFMSQDPKHTAFLVHTAPNRRYVPEEFNYWMFNRVREYGYFHGHSGYHEGSRPVVVDEPGSLMLMLMGLGAMLALRRREV